MGQVGRRRVAAEDRAGPLEFRPRRRAAVVLAGLGTFFAAYGAVRLGADVRFGIAMLLLGAVQGLQAWALARVGLRCLEGGEVEVTGEPVGGPWWPRRPLHLTVTVPAAAVPLRRSVVARPTVPGPGGRPVRVRLPSGDDLDRLHRWVDRVRLSSGGAP